jgi:hypothetical protein
MNDADRLFTGVGRCCNAPSKLVGTREIAVLAVTILT